MTRLIADEIVASMQHLEAVLFVYDLFLVGVYFDAL